MAHSDAEPLMVSMNARSGRADQSPRGAVHTGLSALTAGGVIRPTLADASAIAAPGACCPITRETDPRVGNARFSCGCVGEGRAGLRSLGHRGVNPVDIFFGSLGRGVDGDRLRGSIRRIAHLLCHLSGLVRGRSSVASDIERGGLLGDGEGCAPAGDEEQGERHRSDRSVRVDGLPGWESVGRAVDAGGDSGAGHSSNVRSIGRERKLFACSGAVAT